MTTVYFFEYSIFIVYVGDISDNVPERALQAAMQFLNDNSELYGLYINTSFISTDGFVDEGIIYTCKYLGKFLSIMI